MNGWKAALVGGTAALGVLAVLAPFLEPRQAIGAFEPPIQVDTAAFSEGSSYTLMPMSCYYKASFTALGTGNAGAVACNANRQLLVSVQGSVAVTGSTGGVSATDEAAFTQGTSSDTPLAALYSTSITNLSSGQTGVVQASKERRLVVSPYCKPEDCISGATSTTGTSSTQIIAAVASTKLCITEVSIANTSSTDSLITLQDGSGGTALWYTVAPAKNGFGGSNVPLPSPVCTSSGNGLYFAAGAAATTIYVSAGGFKAS